MSEKKETHYSRNKEKYFERARKRYLEHSIKVKERKEFLKLNDIPIRKK